MFLISDYLKRLVFVASDNGNELYEYKPTLFHPLLVPFEKLSFVRKTRLRLEFIRGGYVVYYLSVGNTIVGYCVVTPGGRRLKKSTKKDIVLGPYYVAPNYRGKGYAKSLIKMTLSNCKYNYEFAYDWIDKRNIGSIKASEACGFQECGNLNVVGLFRRLIETENGDDIIYCYSKPKNTCSFE